MKQEDTDAVLGLAMFTCIIGMILGCLLGFIAWQMDIGTKLERCRIDNNVHECYVLVTPEKPQELKHLSE